MKPLQVHPLRTPIFRRQGDLAAFIDKATPRELIHEGVIVVVTSKIVSLAENRLVAREGMDKQDLVKREADLFIGEIGHGCSLTVKEGLLIPSAGIDESNSETGDFILFPADPYASAENLRRQLQKAWDVRTLGVILTDSHTSPLRRGVTGICLSFAGFKALRNLVASPDLFGRELRMTQMNLADGLAAAAVMMMGEGAESQPLALIQNASVEFAEESDAEDLAIPLEEDLYYPLLKAFMRV
jgi:coenzyme F420-0:L-glutamate ligase